MKSTILIVTSLFCALSYLAQWTEQDEVYAAGAASNDNFGISVDISGDTAIIGAWKDDDDGGGSGSAHIKYYYSFGGTWNNQAKLTASDAAGGDNFGWSVAIDGQNAIVGAPYNDDLGGSSGSAYVFTKSGSIWNEVTKLTASDGAGNDEFGWSVDISGSFAIVGAWHNNTAGGTNAGAAYIFEFDGVDWVETDLLTASDAAANDLFGYSVSISGNRAVVSGRDNDDDGGDSGSVYVFENIAGTWTETIKLTASDAGATDRFGMSCAISDSTIVVGAALDNDAGNDSGSAYVFEYDGANWIETPKLTASDAAAGDQFGIYVAIDDSLCVVGANFDDDNGANSGSAYVFYKNGASWSEASKLTASDGNGSDLFGTSVAISEGIVVCGAHLHDDNAGNSGAAYFYWDPVPGCINQAACNYDPEADIDDGSCILPDGCNNPLACNFDPVATCDDGSCIVPPSNDECVNAIEILPNTGPLPVDNSSTCIDGPNPGCASNFYTMKEAWFSYIHDIGDVTISTIAGTLTDTRIGWYDDCGGPVVTCNDNIGEAELTILSPDLVQGETYYIQAGGHNDLVGTFQIQLDTTVIYGCTDPLAGNYNPGAHIDDGSCTDPEGCTDPTGCNYEPLAVIDNGTCVLPNSCGTCFGNLYSLEFPGEQTTVASESVVIDLSPWEGSEMTLEFMTVIPGCWFEPYFLNMSLVDLNGECLDGLLTVTTTGGLGGNITWDPCGPEFLMVGCEDVPGNPVETVATVYIQLPIGQNNVLSFDVEASVINPFEESVFFYLSSINCDPLNEACGDPVACNYDPLFELDNGLCEYISGCTYPFACNYDPAAGCDDGTCEQSSCTGCAYAQADNYDPSAVVDDGSCTFTIADVCPADLNNDCEINTTDLLGFLSVFGTTCTGCD
jgi:hypothetical protein